MLNERLQTGDADLQFDAACATPIAQDGLTPTVFIGDATGTKRQIDNLAPALGFEPKLHQDPSERTRILRINGRRRSGSCVGKELIIRKGVAGALKAIGDGQAIELKQRRRGERWGQEGVVLVGV